MVKKNFSAPHANDCGGDLSKRWYVSWKEDGKWRKEYVSSDIDTLDERKKNLLVLLKKRQEYFDEVSSSIKDKILGFLEEKKGEWRKKTYQTVASKVKVFFENVGIDNPTKPMVAEFFVQLSKKNHPTTYNNYITTIGMVFREVGRGFLVEDLKKKRAISTPYMYFQPAQIKQLAV